MKHFILFFAFILISFPSLSSDRVYHIIQSWQDGDQNDEINIRSHWENNSYGSLSLCEKSMIKKFNANNQYEITVSETLNVNDEFEEKIKLTIRRDDGTIQVQWICVDFKK
jgi:hypothetical protein